MKIFNAVFLLLLVACILPGSLAGQTLDPQVVAASGFSFSNGNTYIESTVGQIATATFASNDWQITQGFHQPLLLVSAVDNTLALRGVSVFPNPTDYSLYVELPRGLDKNATLVLFDLTGRLLLKKELQESDALVELDLSELADAVYLLTIRQNNSGQFSSFKIFKGN